MLISNTYVLAKYAACQLISATFLVEIFNFVFNPFGGHSVLSK